MPLLMMIAFWTWLWGPVGLLLATPLTVCLLVFAKHVPQLDFVQVLLSDEPAMEMQVSFYQRLLAMDQAEAIEILQQYLKNHEPERVYDELLMPALSYAKEDRRRNNLTDDEETLPVQSDARDYRDRRSRPSAIHAIRRWGNSVSHYRRRCQE